MQSLLKVNDEAKLRISIKSIVLSQAKVTSLESLVEARPKRADKEAKKIAKKKRMRGGKRRNIASKIHMPGVAGEEVCIGEALVPAGLPEMK